MNEIDYCKDCEYYESGSTLDCGYRAPDEMARSNNPAIKYVYTYPKCGKFVDAVNKLKSNRKLVENYALPFGKYKGIKLKDVDTNYIDWLSTLPNLKPPVLTYIKAFELISFNDKLNNSYCDNEDLWDSNSLYREVGYGELC